MSAWQRVALEVHFLLSILILFGLITSCAPILVGPIEPNSALVIGRVVINNKYSGPGSGVGGLLPSGTIDWGIEVEVESRDGSQLFKAKTEEQGHFFIPNIVPNTYVVRRLIVEHRTGDRIQTSSIGVKGLVFTPVPGKTAYIGTLIVDISEKELITSREVREDDRAKAYFFEKHGASSWASREFIAAGPRPMPTVRATAESRPQTVEAKPIMRTGMKAEKPEWKVGYEWRYAWKRPGRSGTLTRVLIREDTFEGVPSYVARVGKAENYYTKDVLGLLATMSGGKVTLKRNAPFQSLSWPLEVGKEWRNSFTLERLEEKSSQTFDNRMVVSKVEEIAVPAGTFEAFKIEWYGSYTGNLVGEYWYSPKVKWFVKERIYHADGVREEELISYKVD